MRDGARPVLWALWLSGEPLHWTEKAGYVARQEEVRKVSGPRFFWETGLGQRHDEHSRSVL